MGASFYPIAPNATDDLERARAYKALLRIQCLSRRGRRIRRWWC
jgi:hypothetical protein